MPSLTVPGPYPDAVTGVVDGVLFQVFYRQMGIVAVNFGTGDVYAAAEWLSQNGRGGTVSWLSAGRVVQWNGMAVAPGIDGSPTMDIWLVGGAVTQRNTVLIRKGFWSFYLFPRVTAARLVITTRIVAALPKPPGA